MKWKRFVKESVDERTFKKLLKQNGVTKLPSGTQFKPDRVSWSKDGGYAGEKTIDRMRQQVEAAGWKQGREMDDAHPDGSWVARGDVYVSPDGQIEMSYYSYYGATSYDNSFSITFKLIGTGVNESEELDDWNDDEPKVYKYYSDEPISPNQFVSLVRSMEQSIEDIFIQNSDFYENTDNPWEEFADDMCQGKSPEEAFDLDYYMNSAARKQLPDDIAKYVYANDFDAMQWLRGIFERLMPICKDPVGESKRRSGFEVVKNIPTWAENYFLYKDETDLNDVDMKLIFDFVEKLKKQGLRLFEPIPGSENEYNDSPAFGYGTSTEDWYARKIVNVGESCNESSRFGFNVGDKVEFKVDMEPNRFGGWGKVKAGTQGEIVNIDKPMKGVIKVKLEDGTVVSVAERKIKFAGTDDEPWNKYKVPAKPKPTLDEILAKHGPEEIYMEPPRPGYPKWTGD